MTVVNPSRCCQRGAHVVETEIAPGVVKCVWCGNVRRIEEAPRADAV